MQNTRLDEAQAGIKIAGRKIRSNNIVSKIHTHTHTHTREMESFSSSVASPFSHVFSTGFEWKGP